MTEEQRAYIAMNMVPGIGAVLARNIGEVLGSVKAVLGATAGELMRVPGIGMERAEIFVRGLATADVETEVKRAEDMGVRLLTCVDVGYPRLLKEIHDPPLVLYVRGAVEALDTAAVAMVGTRTPTQYGRETARRFGFQLAQAGVTVVSGLARGIDTESHKAALQGEGVTIAVIGAALDELYPSENQGLANTIASSRGAVISEYPFGRKANKQTFPMRNRIVSGLSQATLVVEAGVSSGTMITANQAVEQGRSVLSVPGRIDNPLSAGCHKLIKQGARLAVCVDDILDEMSTLRLGGAKPSGGITSKVAPKEVGGNSYFGGMAAKPQAAPAPVLDDTEKALLGALEDAGGDAEIEVLLAKTGLPAYKVNAKLISLEMKRKVQQMPGRRVALKR